MNAHTEADIIRTRILHKLTYAIGKDPVVAKRHDWLRATILALRDSIIDRWMASTRKSYQDQSKRVYYLSLEFLIGRLLRDALSNMELTSAFQEALSNLNVDLNFVEELEPDAALGNGGLGRLAACFMESMATLNIPAYAMVSVTITACSARSSKMAGKPKHQRHGSTMAIRGSSRGAKPHTGFHTVATSPLKP